jgi:hypothetical protein
MNLRTGELLGIPVTEEGLVMLKAARLNRLTGFVLMKDAKSVSGMLLHLRPLAFIKWARLADDFDFHVALADIVKQSASA